MSRNTCTPTEVTSRMRAAMDAMDRARPIITGILQDPDLSQPHHISKTLYEVFGAAFEDLRLAVECLKPWGEP